MNRSRPAPTTEASRWDQRYRQGADGWELGRAAPPLERFLRSHPLAPRPPGPVLVPGCGRGHEAALLEELGFSAIGLDFSGEALGEARALHGPERADLFDQQALEAAGLAPASLTGIVEHTCFCAIDPGRRDDSIGTVCRLVAEVWEPASGSVDQRQDEWIGLWRLSSALP